jgi:hypothetical protein
VAGTGGLEPPAPLEGLSPTRLSDGHSAGVLVNALQRAVLDPNWTRSTPRLISSIAGYLQVRAPTTMPIIPADSTAPPTTFVQWQRASEHHGVATEKRRFHGTVLY